MRLVPEITLQMHSQLKVKVDRLRTQQAAFQEKIVRIACWDITVVDFFDQDFNGCLRDLLMAVRPIDKPTFSLFHSLDRRWSGDGFTFSVIPQFESEARTLLAGLLPFLKFQHPAYTTAIERNFTPVAIDRATNESWDNVNFCVITPDDAMVQFILDEDAEFDFSESPSPISQTVQVVPILRPSAAHLEATTLYGRDNDSVSTTATHPKQGARHKISWAVPPSSSSKVSPQASQSSVSVLTMEEQILAVEQRLEKNIDSKLQELSTQLTRVLELSQPTSAVPPASLTRLTATPQDHWHKQLMVSPSDAGGPRAAGGGL